MTTVVICIAVLIGIELLAPFITMIALFGMLLVTALVHNLIWREDDASDPDGLPEDPGEPGDDD